MSRTGHIAYRLRWLLLLLGGGAIIAAIGAMFFNAGNEPNVWLLIGGFLVTQFLFLAPRRHWPVRLLQSGRSMKLSVFFGAIAATLLTMGFIAAILEIPDWWNAVSGELNWWWVMALIWAAWALIFLPLVRGADRYTRLGKIVRRLIAGSILELLVAVPVQAFVPDRHNCFCARGSLLGIILGTTVLLWTFGPGIVLVFLYEKVRMQRLANEGKFCSRCEYDLRGTIPAGGTVCPECGTAIPVAASKAQA